MMSVIQKTNQLYVTRFSHPFLINLISFLYDLFFPFPHQRILLCSVTTHVSEHQDKIKDNDRGQGHFMAQPVHYIPIITTFFAIIFSTMVFIRYRQKGRGAHLLWWSAGILIYGIGTCTEGFVTLFGWNEPIFCPGRQNDCIRSHQGYPAWSTPASDLYDGHQQIS